jgi:hypothetical protein
MGRIFQDIEDTKICDDGTESYSTTEVPKMFAIVAAKGMGIAAEGEYFEGDPSQ